MTTDTVSEQPAGAVISEARFRTVIGTEWLLTNFGRFTLMPVMAIVLTAQGDGAGWLTGFGLFGFMLCAGLSALLVSRWLPRLSYRVTLSASMVFSAIGFGLLPYADNAAWMMVLLCVAGFGISVHAVLLRVLTPELILSEPGRNKVYSMLNIGTNLAATLGPFIAGALYVSDDSRPLLAFVGLTYLLAGAVLLVGLPSGLNPPESLGTRTRGVAAAVALLRDKQCREAFVMTAIGTFVYAQFYSAFALLVALAIDSTLLRGALLAGPPIAIVVLQTFVTVLANRWLRSGVPPLGILAGATLVFGLAMVFLGVGFPVVLGATLAMALFALAEMLFTPMVSVTFNRISSVSRLAAANLQGVAWTVGEALGSLAGGALFLLCYQRGVAYVYWFALTVGTIAAAIPQLRRLVRDVKAEKMRNGDSRTELDVPVCAETVDT